MQPKSPLTGNQEKAAVLVAADELTDAQIASEVGIHKVTLERWKKLEPFQTRVHEHIQALSTRLERYSIARKDKRVAAYQRRWDLLHEVIEARAESSDPEVAGDATGLIVTDYKGKDADTPVYAVDTGTLAEMRALEKQAAQEAGQWTEKSEQNITAEVGIREYRGVDVSQV